MAVLILLPAALAWWAFKLLRNLGPGGIEPSKD
jgi:hypothetical protein